MLSVRSLLNKNKKLLELVLSYIYFVLFCQDGRYTKEFPKAVRVDFFKYFVKKFPDAFVNPIIERLIVFGTLL